MFRPLARSHRRPQRRGTSFILIVVAMTSLFAAVGTAYALFAMQQARLALARKDEQGASGAQLKAPDPTGTVNQFFSALIFDGNDGNSNSNDLVNALRGHSLARSMYGRDVAMFNAGTPATVPWNGVGPFQDTNSQGQRNKQVNYTVMQISGGTTPTFFLLDPEYMGERSIPSAGPIPQFDPTSRNYVGKNAPYSYPDLKDFFLAEVDPVTGQVLVPSFHRPWLFGSQNLDPANSFWTNPQNKVSTLRPWPSDHPNFPHVPQNPDGTFTGDVQNLLGGVGPQRNDSLWMHIGLGTITLPGGKVVQPLVAPLIIPLNGKFNASVHGNVFNSGSHLSYAGNGPWEVNMSSVLGTTDAATIINARGTPQQRSGINSRSYAPYLAVSPLNTPLLLPGYSPVAWDSTNPLTLAYPSGNSMTGLPAFGTFQSTNAAVTNHPSLFNPTEWPSTPQGLNGRTFPPSDIKRFSLKYAFTPAWYQLSQIGQLNTATPPTVLTSLLGNQNNFPVNVAPGQTTANAYRLDPAHLNRFLFTTTGYDLARPKVVPNFVTNNVLQLQPNSQSTFFAPNPTFTASTQYPTPTTPQTGSDFSSDASGGGHRWSNMLAMLGSVDLNRPLADYRQATTNTLTQDVKNQTRADMDRRKLAHDIFVRLAVATGGGISINQPLVGVEYPSYQYTVNASAGTPQYDALRYLAQLAVNIVDYIDNDDISTVFVWNPKNLNSGTDPSADQSNFTTAEIGNRVVFGVEKPRLVLNEAYSEMTNDPADTIPPPMVAGAPQPLPNTANAHVRFWLELLNPTSPLNPATGPLGNGSVSLSAYQIEIRRETRTSVAANPDPNGIGQNQAPYLLQTNATSFSTSNTNVTGGFTQAQGPADIVLNLSPNGTTVAPNNGNYSPAGAPGSGMVLLAPQLDQTKIRQDEFNPDITSPPWSNAVFIGNAPSAQGSNSLVYTLPLPQAANISSPEFRRNIILLRRLANPYLGQNDPSLPTFNPANPINPYITVDMMDYVPTFDAVQLDAMRTTPQPRVSRPMAGAMNDGSEYDPIIQRFAVGKVQPYAGHAYATVNTNTGQMAYGQYNSYSFGSTTPGQGSMVLNQQMATANNANANGVNKTLPGPFNTFGQHNGKTGNQPGNTFTPAVSAMAGMTTPPTLSDTIWLPFDWLPHLDRPLVNELEIFPVRDTPPHRVTDQFVLGNNGVTLPNPLNSGTPFTPGVSYDIGAAIWTSSDTGLARALEYLTVKSNVTGVPHGGRVPGKINVNAGMDQRVLLGLFDAPAAGTTSGNNFDTTFVTNAAWMQWLASRQTSGVLSQNPSTSLAAVSGASYSSGTVTMTVSSAPTALPYAPGQTVVVSGMTPGGYNGTFNITAVNSTTSFTYSLSTDPGGVATAPFGAVANSTAAGLPGQSIFDSNSFGNDTPFLSFGAPAGATGSSFAFGATTTTGGMSAPPSDHIDWTILRRNVSSTTFQPPLIFANNGSKQGGVTYTTSLPYGPTYAQSEPVRKIMNNITTVNHQYLVYLTIGYFDVVSGQTVTVGPNNMTIPQLGPESFISIPGDMRQQFVAVVDMSNMALDPTTNQLASPTTNFTQAGDPWHPFFTSVDQTAYGNGTATTATLSLGASFTSSFPSGTQLCVASDGVLVPIHQQNGMTPGDTLVIGYGAEQQIVTVTSTTAPTTDPMTGQLTQFGQIAVQTANGKPFRTVWAGTCVSNVVPGYPGPQSNFSYNTAPFNQTVLPYIERIR